MKKVLMFLSTLIAALMVLSLAACGGQEGPGKTTAQPPANTTQQGGTDDTRESDTQAGSSGGTVNPCTLTWLYNADFSMEPKEDCTGTLLPIHAQLPLDLKTMDTELAPYQYVTIDAGSVVVDSLEELLKLDIPAKRTANIIEIQKDRNPADGQIGMPDKIWLEDNKQKTATVSECLQNNWWKIGFGNQDDKVSAFLDIEGDILLDRSTSHQDMNGILAKFGTPHRIYPILPGTLDSLKSMRDGTMEWEVIKTGKKTDYILLWIFPEYVIEIYVSDYLRENTTGSGSEAYRSELRIKDVAYYPRAVWDQLKTPTDNYVDPYQEWGK